MSPINDMEKITKQHLLVHGFQFDSEAIEDEGTKDQLHFTNLSLTLKTHVKLEATLVNSQFTMIELTHLSCLITGHYPSTPIELDRLMEVIKEALN
jgi:hypothetical protein